MKKYFYIIMSVLQIVICLSTLARVPEIVKSQIAFLDEEKQLFDELFSDSFNPVLYEENQNVEEAEIEEEKDKKAQVATFNFDEIFNEAFENLDVESYLTRFLYFTIILVIIFNLIVLDLSITKPILRYKVRIIVYSVINMLLGVHLLISLLALIELIVTICLKRSDEERVTKAPKLEVLEYNYYDKRNRLYAAILIIVYAVCHFFIPMLLAEHFSDIISSKIGLILTIILDIIIFIVAITLFKDELKKVLNRSKIILEVLRNIYLYF